jgi:hypothetical protein
MHIANCLTGGEAMRILHPEICLPRVRTLIQQLPSPDPTSPLLPAQVMLHVTSPLLLLLEILLCLWQHLPPMLAPLQLYLDLVCPLSSL